MMKRRTSFRILWLSDLDKHEYFYRSRNFVIFGFDKLPLKY